MSAQAIRLTDVDIDNALGGHLDVVFQPVFSLRDGALIRVETFVRWDHPGLGLLPPGAFISFFEAQGRMGELTRYVAREATRAYTGWRGTRGPGFSINLAQSDLSDASFPGDLARILGEAGLPPSLVTLECPPFAPDTAPADASLMLGRLTRTGCPLAAEVRGRAGDLLMGLDPFPFAELKTGGAAILRFARTAKGGPGLAAISEILDLAQRHGARAVAVGVEDPESARALASLGFDGGQGKLFGGTGAVDAIGPDAIPSVREALGLAPLSEEALSAMEAPAPAKLAPLVLGAAEASEAPTQAGAPSGDPAPEPSDPHAPDPTMIAIMRLKAKKIAAKKAALKRAEADRERADREAAAARQASDTARRLQERLATELDASPAEDAFTDGAPTDDDADAAVAEAPAETPPADEEPAVSATPAPLPVHDDAEAGVLLSQNLAEIALGVSRQTSFAEGLRMEGYAPSGGTLGAAALAGAVAPEAEPHVRRGEAAPAAFTDVASAIHDILAELPVPEHVKPRLIRSAEMPLTDRGLAPEADEAAAPPEPLAAEDPAAENPAAENLTTGDLTTEDLAADLSAADTLDAVVAASPEIADDAPEPVSEPEADPADLPQVFAARPARRKTNVLTRKYRITHFWPRSWVRAARRRKAARARAAEERIGDAEALA